MKKAVALVVLATLSAGAQSVTRRVANISGLRTYPGFYHLRQLTIAGAITATDTGLRIGDDDGNSILLVTKGPVPEGLDEVRGEFWDIGRMDPADPRLASYDLKRTFQFDPDGPWPQRGEVLAIIAASVTSAQRPTAPSIRAIALHPSRYVDESATVTGQFGGRNLFGDLPDAPGRSRHDFVLRSADAAIWVTGAEPKGKGFNLSLDARLDTSRWLTVTGIVRHGRGLEWLEAVPDSVRLGTEPEDAQPAERVSLPPPPRPEVLFSAPTQDETDVSLGTSVRIQFSRDIDPVTLDGHVRVRYLESQSVERGEPTTPAAQFSLEYRRANRVLELTFSQPLERFRTVLIELTDGILGRDGQPLEPWTLRFDTGG
jgi:hypothetical protein